MIGVAGALAATCLFSGTRVARAEGADEKAGMFSPDGFAVVTSDGDIHFIREDGSDAFGALAARSAMPFCGGVAFVQDGGTEQWACIDVDGEWALESGEDKAHPYVYDASVFFSEGVGLTRGSDGLAYVDNAGSAARLSGPRQGRPRHQDARLSPGLHVSTWASSTTRRADGRSVPSS